MMGGNRTYDVKLELMNLNNQIDTVVSVSISIEVKELANETDEESETPSTFIEIDIDENFSSN